METKTLAVLTLGFSIVVFYFIFMTLCRKTKSFSSNKEHEIVIYSPGGVGCTGIFELIIKSNKSIKLNDIHDTDGVKHRPTPVIDTYKKALYIMHDPLLSVLSHYRRNWASIQMKKLGNTKYNDLTIEQLFSVSEDENKDVFGIEQQFYNYLNSNTNYPIMFCYFTNITKNKDRICSFLEISPKTFDKFSISKRLSDKGNVTIKVVTIYDILNQKFIDRDLFILEPRQPHSEKDTEQVISSIGNAYAGSLNVITKEYSMLDMLNAWGRFGSWEKDGDDKIKNFCSDETTYNMICDYFKIYGYNRPDQESVAKNVFEMLRPKLANKHPEDIFIVHLRIGDVILNPELWAYYKPVYYYEEVKIPDVIKTIHLYAGSHIQDIDLEPSAKYILDIKRIFLKRGYNVELKLGGNPEESLITMSRAQYYITSGRSNYSRLVEKLVIMNGGTVVY